MEDMTQTSDAIRENFAAIMVAMSVLCVCIANVVFVACSLPFPRWAVAAIMFPGSLYIMVKMAWDHAKQARRS